VINDHDAKPALSFTLLHEFTHLLLGHTGVSGMFSQNNIEQFCNDVASDVLLPDDDIFSSFIEGSLLTEIKENVSKKASEWNLSHTTIAYKLYRDKLIDYSTWETLSNEYRSWWYKSKNEQMKKKQKGSGPNYYVVKKYKLGNNIVNSVKKYVDNGAMSLTSASKVLSVSPRNVNNLVS
jgi:Zn-dependent peptidase ImmA (M78 family)